MPYPFFYLQASCIYGAVHSVVRLWDRKYGYVSDRPRQQMLLSDKLANATLATTLGFLVWPYLVHYDLQKMERRLRERDAADFGDLAHPIFP